MEGEWEEKVLVMGCKCVGVFGGNVWATSL